MQIYLNYLGEDANFRKLADVKEELLSGTSQQALSVSLESLLTSDIHISVRGNAVFGRYYAVFQARTPFWKLCPVPWTQFYCGQYSRFEARFLRFQCCNPFCVYERFINSNLIADAQFESPCAAVWHARCRHCHLTTGCSGCNAHRLWCDSGATKRVIHNIFICINHTCAYGRAAQQN